MMHMYYRIYDTYVNYFKSKKELIYDKTEKNKINDEINYNDILIKLSKRSIIKYGYTRSKISGLLLINYTELNFEPLNNIIRNYPYNHGYGNFETNIILLYNDMIKKENIIQLLLINDSWNVPKDIYMYIYKFYIKI